MTVKNVITTGLILGQLLFGLEATAQTGLEHLVSTPAQSSISLSDKEVKLLKESYSTPHKYSLRHKSFVTTKPSTTLTDAKNKQFGEIQNYDLLVKEIESERQEFQKAYSTASENTKKDLIKQGKQYLENTLTKDIWPLWLGTTWDFNGTSEQPLGDKGIACGYFISTTLNQAGVNVSRHRLAQHPSENIIKYLSGDDFARFSNKKPLEKINTYLENKFGEEADGIYIIGLDCHTGFLYKQGDNIDFVHSSYVNPWQVVWEDAFKSEPINSSGYKVIGKLFNDDLVEKWITDERINVRQWE